MGPRVDLDALERGMSFPCQESNHSSSGIHPFEFYVLLMVWLPCRMYNGIGTEGKQGARIKHEVFDVQSVAHSLYQLRLLVTRQDSPRTVHDNK